MWVILFIFLFVFHYVGFVNCGYPQMGDQVQPGSVLLPASRRGRYLANIARRQAVDGTGIKFNEEADRINAEAKKKVDVLSEDLLPYIIAEQERRVTLYKRVMTAIQNGEKGVTIVELRNKPPVVIRHGLLYRCPTNRAPKEPDGSGNILCEDNLEPTPIMFESCLSAEDKELYVADNKYFFCNRHKTEGSDLPRKGDSVVGCAPSERTSLNYTSRKCALEDTDDVVVHYRYYPDRTYKFVSEMDPDREVCEHWNPCQVGYIFSLPSPDHALPAIELWHDDKIEMTVLGQNYRTSTRRFVIPEGYKYHGVGKYLPNGLRSRVSRRDVKFDNIEVISEVVAIHVKITMIFRPVRADDTMPYYVRFEEIAKQNNFVHVPLVTLGIGKTWFISEVVYWLPPQKLKATSTRFACAHCVLRGIRRRRYDGSMRKVNEEKYSLRKSNDKQLIVQLNLIMITLQDFGDYFITIQNDDCDEEQFKALTLKPIQLNRLRAFLVFERTTLNITYACADCEITDVLCQGGSMIPDLFKIEPASKNIVVIMDKTPCVFVGIFKIGDTPYRKIVAVLSTVNITDGPFFRQPPVEGAPFELKFQYTCNGNCSLATVNVNGIHLKKTMPGSIAGSVGYFLTENRSATISITEYTSLYEGVYQGTFYVNGTAFTKDLLEIGPKENQMADFLNAHVPFDMNLEGMEEIEYTEKLMPPHSVDNAEPEAEPDSEAEPPADGRKKHQPPKTHRSGEETEKACMVHILRDSVPAGHAYKQKTVEYFCPDGQLVAVSCRGQNVTTGFGISTKNTVNIDFDSFEDTDACVYMGMFKIGQTEHRKTLAVLENSLIDVTVSAISPPPWGAFNHKVFYTCNVTQCDPAMIYINDKTLRSDDKNRLYSYTSEMVKGSNKEIKVVTIHFLIKPFTEEYEGVYQLVVTNGTERVTKNIMEIGAVV